MYIAGASAQFEIHTLAGVEINTCLFQTGCQLSSAASVPLLKLCLLAQFLWRETNVLDNCQMALLPRIERREFNPCMVHGNFSVPFYFGVVTVFLCQSINKKAHQICTYVYMGVSMYVCVCVYRCVLFTITAFMRTKTYMCDGWLKCVVRFNVCKIWQYKALYDKKHKW